MFTGMKQENLRLVRADAIEALNQKYRGDPHLALVKLIDQILDGEGSAPTRKEYSASEQKANDNPSDEIVSSPEEIVKALKEVFGVSVLKPVQAGVLVDRLREKNISLPDDPFRAKATVAAAMRGKSDFEGTRPSGRGSLFWFTAEGKPKSDAGLVDLLSSQNTPLTASHSTGTRQ